jgi:hypothetical protein
MQKATAGSFLSSAGTAPNNFTWGSRPLLGIKDASIMNAVKTGQMTQYTRYPTCVAISAGCPCTALNASLNPFNPAIPGPVSGITFTVGSIVVSWSAPSTGVGPFRYVVTPYLNGVAQATITTSETSHRFTNLDDWQPYTFTVCAVNDQGMGPIVPSSSYFLAPPESLSLIMSGSSVPTDPAPSLTYLMNDGVSRILTYTATAGLGPTRTARVLYLWSASVVQAWNWITSDGRVSGVHDGWNWDARVSPLSDNDSVVWMMCILDYVTSFFIPGVYQSIYSCPADAVARVKAAANWDGWASVWSAWALNRQSDGSVAAAAQPTDSANWNETIVVDGVTVSAISSFPQPQQWTRLTINGKKQNYATYNWDSVLSTCLTEQNELEIQNSVSLSEDRNAEIDAILQLYTNLSDEQKAIAEFWAGSNAGMMSPPAMCAWLWKEYIRSNTVSGTTMMYSLLDLSIHLFEGSRVTWRLKKLYMESRPIQEIRRRYTGLPLTSWNGVIDGSQWTPYQNGNMVTPPFADFPSGHSHFSKGFALTMNKWFGPLIVKNQMTYDGTPLFCPIIATNQTASYGDFTVPIGASTVEPGVAPLTAIPLSFRAWDEMADQAGMSRIYGGIHALSAHQGSQTTAVEVDGFINATWNINAAPIFASYAPPIPDPEAVDLADVLPV